jgi:hypothetical protein
MESTKWQECILRFLEACSYQVTRFCPQVFKVFRVSEQTNKWKLQRSLGTYYTRFSFLYGCETWSHALGEEYRLRVIERRMPRRIFWPKREEGNGGWRELHNEELLNLYSLQNITRIIKSRRMRWKGDVANMREMRNAYNILVRQPEGEGTARKT